MRILCKVSLISFRICEVMQLVSLSRHNTVARTTNRIINDLKLLASRSKKHLKFMFCYHMFVIFMKGSFKFFQKSCILSNLFIIHLFRSDLGVVGSVLPYCTLRSLSHLMGNKQVVRCQAIPLYLDVRNRH